MPTGSNNKPTHKRDPNRALHLRFERGRMIVVLCDGRKLSVPLKHYPTLRHATPRQRERWELLGGGMGIHWEAMDLDLSIEGLLQGLPERIPRPPAMPTSLLEALSARRSRRTAARRVG
jgi:hypothetical protein